MTFWLSAIELFHELWMKDAMAVQTDASPWQYTDIRSLKAERPTCNIMSQGAVY